MDGDAGAQLLGAERLTVAVEHPQAGGHGAPGTRAVALQGSQQRHRVPGLDAQQRGLAGTGAPHGREGAACGRAIARGQRQATREDVRGVRVGAAPGALQPARQQRGVARAAVQIGVGGLRVCAERDGVCEQRPRRAPLAAEGVAGAGRLVDGRVVLAGGERRPRAEQPRLRLLGRVAADDEGVDGDPGAGAGLGGEAGGEQQLGAIDVEHRAPGAAGLGLAVAPLRLVEPAQRRRHVAAPAGDEAEVVRAASHRAGPGRARARAPIAVSRSRVAACSSPRYACSTDRFRRRRSSTSRSPARSRPGIASS